MTNITVLFDKSFLQSLNVDESVWFDNFFITNVCPFFFVETLSDLEKKPRKGLTSEQEVKRIVEKTPQMRGTPCIFHNTLVMDNLQGKDIFMDGRIHIAGGHLVGSDEKTGMVFKGFPEAKAFWRWRKGEFLEVERLFARSWRKSLSSVDQDRITFALNKAGIAGKSCNTLEEAKTLASSITSGSKKNIDLLSLSLIFLGENDSLESEIRKRYNSLGNPTLSTFAPYAAFVLTLEIFLRLAVNSGLISGDNHSRIDIAYLFYLPFCKIFVSYDKLHEKCTPLFLRKDQHFIWGPDLKSALAELDDHYKKLPDNVKEKGVISFAAWPPKDDHFLVTRIYDEYLPGWRKQTQPPPKIKPEEEIRLIKQYNKLLEAPVFFPEKLDFNQEDVGLVSIERFIQKKKGSWYQVDKNTEEINLNI